MIGWVLPEAASAAIKQDIAAAFDARGKPHYWDPGFIRIAEGPYASEDPAQPNVFLPMSDADKAQRMNSGDRLQDYPEYASLAAHLGGEGARVDVDPAHFEKPEGI